ncbi:MAG: helicase RepA family protein [Candidatus Eisenbacteria bacterium]|uniref:Helicase RepA family protein n=1 Tax=Eiseniibacteriota bacterium TaxID=2212470 RepID=A0A948RYN9_UNCEI|nr:helicase RepA family protein [Candidatus Eisenbacteria bacterium]
MIKWRVSLSGDPKYIHAKGDSARVYGLNWLAQREDKCFVVLVEGESCTWTLLHCDYPVLGIPGASNAEKLELVHIRDVPYIYIVQERDDAGCQFVDGLTKRLRALHWVGDVFILQPPEGIKDTNDWYKSDPDGFKPCFEKALEDAAPLDYFPDPFKGAILDCGSFLQEDIRRPNNLLGDGVLTEGCLAVLYGVPGTGKSWALLQQAVAIATGSVWFGFPTVRTRVAYLNLELPGYYLKERVQTILRASEIPDDLFLISQPFLTGRIDVLNPDHILGFKRMIKNHGIRLLILDAFSRIHTADEISGQQMGEVMGACDELRFETKSAVELCHHERKGQTSRGSAGDSDIDALRGHSRLLSDPQTLIRLREVKKRLRLAFTKLNLGPPVDGIWLARREDGTFEVTEEPPDKSMEREENIEALENAGREAGAAGLTVAKAQALMPHRRGENTVHNIFKDLGFKKVGSGRTTTWVFKGQNESRN